MLDVELGRRSSFTPAEVAGADREASSDQAQSLRNLRLTTRRPASVSRPSRSHQGPGRALDAARDMFMLLQQNADRVLWTGVVLGCVALA